MATATSYFNVPDAQHPGINNNRLQESPYWVEVPGNMASADIANLTFPAPGDTFLPPLDVIAVRHTGGDVTSSASATFAQNNGDTIEFQIDSLGNGVFTSYIHTLVNVTNGSATAAQIAASINGDAKLAAAGLVAVAGLTANAVTIFCILPRAAARVGSLGTVTAITFTGTADSKKRTYVSQSGPILTGGTGFSWSFVASTRVLTIKNETGGTINRTVFLIRR